MPKLSGWLLLLLLLVACAPQRVDTPVPTQTLIPPTVTPTNTPTIPTITPQDLPAPQDFSLTPSPTPLQPLIDTDTRVDSDMIRTTRQDLADNTGVAIDLIQLVEVTPRIYYSVECPTGRQVVPTPLSSGYEIVWIVENQSHQYLTWDDTEFVWCEIDRLRGEYLTAIDPIAAELSALAVRRVRQQTGVDDEDVVLEDVYPVQWQDTSVGCPQDGQTYASAQLDGYRIVISDGETSYLFHTDSVQLIPCEFDRATN